MVPSNKWFPQSLSARATWADNFNIKFTALAASFGFTPAEVTGVQDDMKVLLRLAGFDEQTRTYAEAMRDYRINITEGGIGEPLPTFPANPDLTAPSVVPTGIFQRLIELRDRILVAPNYTSDLGAQLGILSEQPVSPNQIKPEIRVTAHFNGYKFDVVTTKNGMQAFKVLIRRMDSEAWQEAAFGTTSPLVVTVTPHTAGQAERIQVCVQLIDKNQPVGVPSDVVYVTINP